MTNVVLAALLSILRRNHACKSHHVQMLLVLQQLLKPVAFHSKTNTCASMYIGMYLAVYLVVMPVGQRITPVETIKAGWSVASFVRGCGLKRHY